MDGNEKLDVEVLFVEDEEASRAATAAVLARRVRVLMTAENGQQGLALFRVHRPDIVITDIMMPGMDGLAMAKEMRAIDPRQQIIVLTAHNDPVNFITAIDIGVDQYVLKPVDDMKLWTALEKCNAVMAQEKIVAQHNRERERLIAELQDALAHVKTLSGFLPICAWCKKIRSDEGYWTQLEDYITAHSQTVFSHSCCPECAKKVRAELDKILPPSKQTDDR